MRKSGDKILRVQFVFALLGSFLFASANAETVTLTFATQDFPPFNREIKGSAAGPFADIVRLICQRMQTDCTIETLPWRRVIGEAQQLELSGIFPMSRLPERESDYYFIGPILETNFTVYTLAGDTTEFREGKDFAGYTIGVYGPSGISKTLEQITAGIPSVKIVMELNHVTVLRKLSAGRYGAKGIGFIDRDGAQYLMSDEHITNVYAAGDIKIMDLYICLSRKLISPEIAARFETTFAALNNSGELAAILKKYGLKPAPPRPLR